MEFPFDTDHGEQNKGYPYPRSLGGIIRTSFSQNKKKKKSKHLLSYFKQISLAETLLLRKSFFPHPGQMVYISHHLLSSYFQKSLKEICKATVTCHEVTRQNSAFTLGCSTR